MYVSQVGILNAQNATETTATEGGEMTVPAGVRRVIGVGIQIKAAGLTTLESLSGILRLISKDRALPEGEQAFPLPMQNVLTSGAVALNPFIHPTDFPVVPGSHIVPEVAFDMALTVTPSWRVHLIYA